jgi:hypothetical protein
MPFSHLFCRQCVVDIECESNLSVIKGAVVRFLFPSRTKVVLSIVPLMPAGICLMKSCPAFSLRVMRESKSSRRDWMQR